MPYCLKTCLKRFRTCESGAVTVDWIVLTAAIVGLAVAVLASIGTPVASEGDDLRRCMNRIGNTIDRDDRTHAQQMRMMERRCARL